MDFSQDFWAYVLKTVATVICVCAVSLTVVGFRAYTSGASPGAAEGFTAFAGQVLRIATVLAIVAAALAVKTRNNQSSDTAFYSILSGIAGYVLGGIEKTPRSRREKDDKPSNSSGNKLSPPIK
jgi:hypothetical protein